MKTPEELRDLSDSEEVQTAYREGSARLGSPDVVVVMRAYNEKGTNIKAIPRKQFCVLPLPDYVMELAANPATAPERTAFWFVLMEEKDCSVGITLTIARSLN